jgi:hypothetical protein
MSKSKLPAMTKPKKTKDGHSLVPTPSLTPQQRIVVEKHVAKLKSKAFELKYEATKEGKIGRAGPDSFTDLMALIEALGGADPQLAYTIEKQLLNIVREPGKMTAAVQFLQSQKPANEIECLLLTQIFSSHVLAMEFASRSVTYKDPDIAERNAGRACRLMRTFAEHLETLNRIRGKGQQKVTVEHVHVHNGGQAVIAPIVVGGGGKT